MDKERKYSQMEISTSEITTRVNLKDMVNIHGPTELFFKVIFVKEYEMGKDCGGDLRIKNVIPTKGNIKTTVSTVMEYILGLTGISIEVSLRMTLRMVLVKWSTQMERGYRECGRREK